MPPKNVYRDGKRPTKGVMKSSNAKKNFSFNFNLVKPVLRYSIIYLQKTLPSVPLLQKPQPFEHSV